MIKRAINPVRDWRGNIKEQRKVISNGVKKQRKNRSVPREVNRMWGKAKRLEHRRIK